MVIPGMKILALYTLPCILIPISPLIYLTSLLLIASCVSQLPIAYPSTKNSECKKIASDLALNLVYAQYSNSSLHLEMASHNLGIIWQKK